MNENVAKKITSIQTLYNKYSHIRSFLKSQGSTKFYIERDQLIEKINLKEKDITEQNILSDETIKTILGFYSKRRESIRNTAIFLVCLCYGFERSTLSKLSFDNVKNKKLFIEDRVLDIPPKLFNVLSELKSVNKKNKVKGNYFFYSSINNSKVLANQSFNEIFKLLGKIDDNDPKWNSITPTAIRASLIRRMFNNNYSIEEISYITGADLINLANIISYEDILSKVKSKKKISVNKHPFNFVLY
ncbi:tyrosine-type recombinase/integrase [Sporolactobacillus laevolacticus]|uniref:tyrosine-type recombinase/integrase n=1 Tax=Sporolactobacillus laevolacticus TaxID=33018 RepID=UPI0014431E0F|nr:tyrosine-type recombinase/integrase [Sporolactobacillus laevolacticus]